MSCDCFFGAWRDFHCYKCAGLLPAVCFSVSHTDVHCFWLWLLLWHLTWFHVWMRSVLPQVASVSSFKSWSHCAALFAMKMGRCWRVACWSSQTRQHRWTRLLSDTGQVRKLAASFRVLCGRFWISGDPRKRVSLLQRVPPLIEGVAPWSGLKRYLHSVDGFSAHFAPDYRAGKRGSCLCRVSFSVSFTVSCSFPLRPFCPGPPAKLSELENLMTAQQIRLDPLNRPLWIAQLLQRR